MTVQRTGVMDSGLYTLGYECNWQSVGSGAWHWFPIGTRIVIVAVHVYRHLYEPILIVHALITGSLFRRGKYEHSWNTLRDSRILVCSQ